MKSLLRLSHFGLSPAVFLLALACGTEDPGGGPQAGASGAPSGIGGAIGGSGGQAVAGSLGIAGSPAGGSSVGGGGVAGSPVAGSSTGGSSGGKPSAGAGGTAAGAGGASAGAGGSSGGTGGASGGSSGGSGGAPSNGGTGGGSSSGEFKLTAPWDSGDATCAKGDTAGCANIPDAHRSAMVTGADTMPGKNQLPPLSWTPGPTGTQGYALVFHDLSNGFAHWAMWKIPANVTSVAADNLPQGIDQGSLSSNGSWYGPGSCTNAYELVVYAVNTANLEPSGSGSNDQTKIRNQLEAQGNTVVLARDAVRGTPKMPCMLVR